MKALSTITILLTTANFTFAQNIDDPSPNVLSDDVVIQSFTEEKGGYTAADFNSNPNTFLTNFDSPDTVLGGSGTGFQNGNQLAGILYTDAGSGVTFRTNFQKLSGAGFNPVLTDGSTFVSSSPLALTTGNGDGFSVTLPEFLFGSSFPTQDVYGVGFTIARLPSEATVTLYSDIDGSNPIATSVSFAENTSGSGYSFFGYAGDTVIRRIDIAVDNDQFAIDDLIFTTNAIPEPSVYATMLGAVVFFCCVRMRRKNRK